MAKKKCRTGARGKYVDWITPEGLLKIEGWARDGLTDKQIAQNIGVNERTFTRWKSDHPSIMSVLKTGKEVVDRQVENALLKNALGFEYEETKTIIEISPDGEKKQRVEKIKKYSPPNPTSQIFWLKNRKPAEWRDRRETEITGNLNVANIATEIDDYLNGDST
ncbi:CII family transcriptional regulator [Vagococcus lutrae]|uniref:CII family transcriptional regulator n=1 Tax=Vagococcus lutrae TaxID=81947 RepID=UPI00288FD8E9|nr:CII family transcriptional regulator [Vagococcus lutrae]MDT2824361.1 CII family transcriptional regulator [Vagococcus lutrae]